MQAIIYTRQGCPLCGKGIAAALSVFGEANITLVDIDLDLALMDRYTNRVPVIEAEDGTVIDEGVVTETALRAFVVRTA
ncbi:MAG: glutaredoxin family protein [Acidimicrobiia bacterium]